MDIGLRIDVDTLRGTRYGVPNLCNLLHDHSIKASFFFSVGPDNMGRHLWRLFRPSFFWKMLRSKAAGLYGWDILLRGTFWPGPCIGEKSSTIIQSTSSEGHEIGLHAWDHHKWQTHIDAMDSKAILHCLNSGFESLKHILGKPPTCSATPAWRCNDLVLRAKSTFPFEYNSDCRGKSIFYPLVDEKELSQPQIPVTLPTYDEVIGRNGITNNTYNDYLFSLLDLKKLNVLTIHAEVEGIVCLELFDCFLKTAQSKGFVLVPLGNFLKNSSSIISRAAIVPRKICGREGWVSCQV